MRALIHPDKLLRRGAFGIELPGALRQGEGVLRSVQKQDGDAHLVDIPDGRALADVQAGFPARDPEDLVQNREDGPFFRLHVQLEGFAEGGEESLHHDVRHAGREFRL